MLLLLFYVHLSKTNSGKSSNKLTAGLFVLTVTWRRVGDDHIGDVDGNDVVVEGEDMEFVLLMAIVVSLMSLMLMAMMRMLLLVVKTLKSASLTGGQGLITRESGRLTVWWIE